MNSPNKTRASFLRRVLLVQQQDGVDADESLLSLFETSSYGSQPFSALGSHKPQRRMRRLGSSRRHLDEAGGDIGTGGGSTGNDGGSRPPLSNRTNPLVIAGAAIVALACLLYVVKRWCCWIRKDNNRGSGRADGDGAANGGDATILVHAGHTVLVRAGRMFKLTDHQRRAALETIFSDPTTKEDSSDEDTDGKSICAVAPVDTMDCTSEECEDSDAADASRQSERSSNSKGIVVSIHPNSLQVASFPARQPNKTDSECSSESSTCSPKACSVQALDTGNIAKEECGDSCEAVEVEAWKDGGTRTTASSDPPLDRGRFLVSTSSSERLPDGVRTKQDAQGCDESNHGDMVCSICLDGYSKGDASIVSKYCTHKFHKNCILEWLEKHGECPICRTGMITDMEMSKAATSLVGKTRMYRAVQTIQVAPPLPVQATVASGTPAQPTRPTPLRGTMRRYSSMNSSGTGR